MLKYVFSLLLIAATWGLVIWFEQPWWIAIAVTAVVITVLAAVIAWQIYRARKSAKEIEQALKAQGDAHAAGARPDLQGEIERMQAEFQRAVAALQGSKVGRGSNKALYLLPWYVIIGPPGAGKSTAIRNSGLRFPYLSPEGKGAISGVGGTRNCDWWMTNEAVLLDTAGRYTTADEDRDEWFSFLDLLERTRVKRPINGVIVAISITELQTGQLDEVTIRAKEVRSRIDQLMERLEMVVPVYVVFTKCDLIPGFLEMFASLDADRRRQIWGFTVPVGATKSMAEIVSRNFDDLANIVDRRALRQMAKERNVGDRASIYSFPQHFDSLKANVTTFIGELFAESIYHESPIMRGVYFTSGTQEGKPVDQMVGSVAEAFGVRSSRSSGQSAPAPTEAKSYFLGDVFTKVIFPDRDVASRSRTRLKKQRLILNSIAALVILAAVGAAILPTIAFRNNRELVGDTSAAMGVLIDHYKEDPVDTIPVERLLPLHGVYERLAAHRKEGPPTTHRFGMYQGNELLPAIRALYASVVRNELIVPVVGDLEGELRNVVSRQSAGKNEGLDYQANLERLRTYLLLTGPPAEQEPKPSTEDQTWLADYLVAAWNEALATGSGETPEDTVLQTVASSFAEITAEHPRYRTPRDEALVEDVRRVLTRTDTTEALLARIVQLVDQQGDPIGLRNMVAAPSIQNGGKTVQFAFTRPGWKKVKEYLDSPMDDLETHGWVLGRADEQEEIRAEERAAVRSRYFEQYIAQWQGFIGSIYVAMPQNYVEALTMMQDLTRGPTPPFAALLQHIAYHTRLTEMEKPSKKDDLLDKAEKTSKKKLAKKGKKGRAASGLVDGMGRDDGTGKYLGPADVEDAFVGLVRFGVPPTPPPQAEGAPPPAPEAVALDVYQEQLVYIRDALQARLDDPGQQDALTTRVKTARGRIKGLLAEQDVKWKPRLEAMLWPPIEAVWNLAGQSAAADLASTWCQAVVLPYEQQILPRYPFSPQAHDVPLADFVKFFKPESGTLWQFYQSALASRIPQEGDRFSLAEQGRATQNPINPALVGFLQQAHDLTKAMFPADATAPKVDFDVLIHGTPSISETIFTVDGASIRYRNGPETWERVVWPGEGDQRGASIRAKGFGIDGRVEQEGEWGLLRLLEQGTVDGAGGKAVFSVKWDLTDQRAGVINIKIRPRRRDTPFFGVTGRPGDFMALFRSARLKIPHAIVSGGPRCQFSQRGPR